MIKERSGRALDVRNAISSERRGDKTKLLVIERQTQKVSHGVMHDLPRILRKGDLLVVNDAATLPASLSGVHLATGRKIELRLAMPLTLPLGKEQERNPIWLCVLFGAGDWRTPTENRAPPPLVDEHDLLNFDFGLKAEVLKVRSEISTRLIEVKFDSRSKSVWSEIYLAGHPIQYSYLRETLKLWDQQTIFAVHPVAVEPPSASFSFSWDLVFRLKDSGVDVATLTHATGLSSTGDPRIDSRLPFPEYSHVPQATVRAIEQAKREGRRVIAVGTGVTRALESGARQGFRSETFMSELHIEPETPLQVVSGILTGMHEAGASHLDLLGAFVNKGTIERAYVEAQGRDYLWHEYGDVCLILSTPVPRMSATSSTAARPFR